MELWASFLLSQKLRTIALRPELKEAMDGHGGPSYIR